MTHQIDLLKQHRAHHLFSKHGLFQIPLASEMLEESFKGQVASSPNVCDIKPDDVLVVFVHDLCVHFSVVAHTQPSHPTDHGTGDS